MILQFRPYLSNLKSDFDKVKNKGGLQYNITNYYLASQTKTIEPNLPNHFIKQNLLIKSTKSKTKTTEHNVLAN